MKKTSIAFSATVIFFLALVSGIPNADAIEVNCARAISDGCDVECRAYDAAWDELLNCLKKSGESCNGSESALDKASVTLNRCLRR